jgi:protein O-GlcNAc transferase
MPIPEPRTVSIPEALQLGVQHHQAGRLADAERIYQQILAAEPENPHALQLLGLIAHTAGKHEIAVELMLKALAHLPAEPVILNNLG